MSICRLGIEIDFHMAHGEMIVVVFMKQVSVQGFETKYYALPNSAPVICFIMITVSILIFTIMFTTVRVTYLAKERECESKKLSRVLKMEDRGM